MSSISNSLQALAYLLGAAAVTYPLVAASLRPNRRKEGHR